MQNIDRLDIHEKETSDVLNELHGENRPPHAEPAAGPEVARNSSELPATQDLTKRHISVVATKKRIRQVSSPDLSGSSSDSSSSGEDEYAGNPISAGTLRRVFGSRKKARRHSNFELTQELIDEVAGSAMLVLSEAMAAMVTPSTIDEAQQTPEWPQWKAAIEKELQDLQANGTWEVAKTPARANVVSSK